MRIYCVFLNREHIFWFIKKKIFSLHNIMDRVLPTPNCKSRESQRITSIVGIFNCMQENKEHLSNRQKKIQVNASNGHLSQLSVYLCLMVAFLPAMTNSIRSPAQFHLPQAVPLLPLFVFWEFYYLFCWKQGAVKKFGDLQAQMKKENNTCYMRSNYVDILFIISIIFLPPNSPCSIKVLHVLVEQKCSCIW